MSEARARGSSDEVIYQVGRSNLMPEGDGGNKDVMSGLSEVSDGGRQIGDAVQGRRCPPFLYIRVSLSSSCAS